MLEAKGEKEKALVSTSRARKEELSAPRFLVGPLRVTI
jgi:hypothetical protein